MRAGRRLARLVAVVVALVSVVFIPAMGSAEGDRPRRLLVGSEVDFPPFALGAAGGDADGFTVDLWKAVARVAGLDYRIVVAPFHQLLDGFRRGEIDVMINLAQSAERMQFADFSVAHVNVQGTLFARKGDRRIGSQADLGDKSVVVIRADFFHRVAESMGLKNLVPVDTAAEAMNTLAAGRHDGVLMARLVGLQTLRDLDLEGIVPALTLPEPRQKFAFAVHKGETELLAQINEALAETRVSGEYNALYEKWFGLIDPRQPTLAQIAAYVVPSLLIIALIGLAYLRQRHLARSLAQSTSSLRAMMDNFPHPVWLKDRGGRILAVNEPFARACNQPSVQALVGKTDLDIWPREQAQAYRADDVRVMETKQQRLDIRALSEGGTSKWLETFNTPVIDGAGKLLGTTGFARDITEKKLAEDLLVGQRDVLELIAKGTPLAATFDKLNRLLEAQMPGAMCSICTVDDDRLTLRVVSAPSLPSEYVQAIGPIPIGSCAGSRGAAGYAPVIVYDLAADATWAGLRHIAQKHDLRTCWSTPIFDSQKQVVGAFVVYFREPRTPEDRHRKLIEVAIHGLSIAIERERAERSLREYQAMLEKAEEVSRMGSWDWNLRTRVVNWSSQTYQIFSADPSLSRESVSELVESTAHPADRERLKQFFRRAVTTPGSHEIEYRLLCRDGSVRIIQLEGQLVCDAESRPVRFVGTAQDITERRAAEDKLKELAFRLEEAQRIAQIGSWEWDITENLLWWSDEVFRVFGISKGEFGADIEAFWARVHREDLAAVKASEQRAFRGLGHDVEHRIVLADGSVRWVHELGEVVFDQAGKPVRMRGTVQDITRRKTAEEALAEGQALLRCLLDSIPDIIFYKDKDGRYLGCNPATEAVLGRPEAEWVGKTDWDLFPAEVAQEFRRHDEKMMTRARARRNEEWVIYPDGRRVLLEMLKTPYRGPRGECLGVIGIGRDITERKKAEAELKESKDALERAVSLLDATIESTADGVLVVGLDGAVTKHNQRFVEMWQIPGDLIAQREEAPLRAHVLAQLKDPEGFDAAVREVQLDPEKETVAVFEFLDGRIYERYSRPQWVDHRLAGIVLNFRDITQRRRAEAALRESEERYRILVEGTSVIAWELDLGRFVFTYVSPQAETLIGYPVSAWYEEGFWAEHLHPEDRDFAVSYCQSCTRQGRDHRFEYRMIKADGNVIWIEDVVSVLTDDSGKPKTLRGIMVDITERKNAEHELKLTATRLRRAVSLLDATLESTADGILVVDAERKVSQFNRRFLELWRIPPALAAQRDDAALLAYVRGQLEDPDEFSALVEDLYADAERESYDTISFQDGRVFERYSRPQRVEQEIVGRVWSFRDVTKRVRAEEAVREREARLAGLVGSAMDAIVSIDADQRIVLFNRSAERMFGWPAGEVLGQRVDMLIPERHRHAHAEHIRTFAATGISSRQMGRLGTIDGLRRNGEQFPIEASISQTTVGKQRMFTVILRDVTERLRAEQEIRELNEALEERVRRRTAELEASNMELESFSYSVSHDLRAPLRVIDGWSHVLLDDYGSQLDGQATEYLNRVRAATKRMSQLIDDLLTLAQVTRSEMKRIDVDLSQLARERAQELQRADPRRSVEFVITPGLITEGDPGLLAVAIQNLLENAWKFTAKQPAARIEFGAETNSGKPVYFVRDNGAGFDMAYADRLFSAFQRLHRPAEFPGTGIGLATVLRIIRRHGGRVWAEGAEGCGATFRFTLD